MKNIRVALNEYQEISNSDQQCAINLFIVQYTIMLKVYTNSEMTVLT